MINVKIEADSRFLEKYTTLSDIAILTQKMTEVDNRIRDITEFTVKCVLSHYKLAMFYGGKKDRHMYLVGTQDEDVALKLEKLVENNGIIDTVYKREDLWFQEYKYGYVYEIVPSFISKSNRGTFEYYIFRTGNFYFINPREKQISIPLRIQSPLDYQMELEEQREEKEVIWLGYVEIKDIGWSGNILLCKNPSFNIIFPEFLKNTNIIYKIFPTLWQYVIKELYFTISNLKLSCEEEINMFNELYKYKFREIVYNSCAKGEDIGEDEYFFTTLEIAT